MRSKQDSRAWATGAAVLAALGPWVVLPGAGDAFELPKRLVWSLLGMWLAWGSVWVWRGQAGTRGFWVAWWGLMAWMVARSFLGDGWGHWAAPWMAWAMPLTMFALAAANRWSGPEKRLMARAIAVSGVAESLLLLAQRWGVDPLWGAVTSEMAYAPARMVGTVGYQNQSAEFLGLAAVCTVYGWRGRWRWVACACLLWTLALTANRGAVAGAVTAALAMALATGRGAFRGRARSWKRAWIATASVFAAILAVVAIPEMRLRVAELTHPGDSVAVQSRIWMARVALAMWREHPWAGCGGGAFGRGYLDGMGRVLPETKELPTLKALVYARETHCDILQFGAEFGAVGLLLLILVVVGAARLALHAKRADRCAGIGVAAFMGVASLVSFSWQTSLAGPLAGLLLGMWCCGDCEAGAAKLRKRARVHAGLLSLWALWLMALAFLENARSLGIRGIPLRGPALAAEGVRLHDSGRLEEALAAFELAGRDVPSPVLLRNLGATLVELGRWEEASKVYGRWVRCGLSHGHALWNLSVSLEHLGRFNEAAAVEVERCRLFPNLVTGDQLYRLAVLHLRTGNPHETLLVAEQWHRRCAEINPNRWTPEWDNLSGRAWLVIGAADRARTFFESAIRSAPAPRHNPETLPH